MTKGNKSGNTAPEQPTVTTPPKNGGHPAEVVICSNEEYNEDLKKRLEEEKGNGIQLIKYEDLIVDAPDLAIWLKEIVRYGNVDSQILIYRRIELYPETLDIKEKHFSCVLYTNEHKYAIYCNLPTKKNPRGYLGAGGSTRKPRPGEFWDRGNDLPDGKYCKKTFDDIIRGIVAYELKDLQLWRK